MISMGVRQQDTSYPRGQGLCRPKSCAGCGFVQAHVNEKAITSRCHNPDV
jgi:hypothetical protein